MGRGEWVFINARNVAGMGLITKQTAAERLTRTEDSVLALVQFRFRFNAGIAADKVR